MMRTTDIHWPRVVFAALVLSCTSFASAVAQDPDGGENQVVVRGRIVLPDGEPAVGIPVAFAAHTMPGTQPASGTWKAPGSTTTDDDGRFEFRFEPVVDRYASITTRSPGHCSPSWMLSGFDSPHEQDLGEVVLKPEGVVEGVILDTEGNTLISGWRVTARTGGRTGFTLGSRRAVLQPQSASAYPDAETGVFRLEGLPAGAVTLTAYARGTLQRVEDVEAVVKAGEVSRVVIEYVGPDHSQRITVRVDMVPVGAVDPDRLAIELVSEFGDVLEAEKSARSYNMFHFADVPDGEYELVIDDERFEPLRRKGVRPGDDVRVTLDGNAAVRLRVIEPGTGEEVRAFGLTLEYIDPRRTGRAVVLAPDGARNETFGYFGRLVPGDLRLEVRAEGYPPTRVEVNGLAARETREVTVELARGATLSGRVVDADGAPVAGVTVERTPSDSAGHDLGPTGSIITNGKPVPRVVENVETSVDGRFVFENVEPGPQTLRAKFARWLTADGTFELEPGGAEDVEIVKPPSGGLRGRVFLPLGADVEQYELDIAIYRTGPIFLNPYEAATRVLQEDGTFDVSDLPVGQVRLNMLMSERVDTFSINHSQESKGTAQIRAGEVTEVEIDHAGPRVLGVRVLLGGETVEGGTVSVHPDVEGVAKGALKRRKVLVGEALFTQPPRGPCRVYYSPDPDLWTWVRPDPIVVPAAGNLDVVLQIEVARKVVTFLDASTGEPLRETKVRCVTGRLPVETHTTHVTDAEGKLELELCTGEVRFSRHGIPYEEAKQTAVEWVAEGDELVVRIAGRKDD